MYREVSYSGFSQRLQNVCLQRFWCLSAPMEEENSSNALFVQQNADVVLFTGTFMTSGSSSNNGNNDSVVTFELLHSISASGDSLEAVGGWKLPASFPFFAADQKLQHLEEGLQNVAFYCG